MKIKIGDLVTLEYPEVDQVDLGVGLVLEVLTGGYARKNPSALVYWSNLETTSFHTEPSLTEVKK